MIGYQIQKILYSLFFFGFIYSQTNVAIVSEKVGTEIDVHENRFYRIFPDEKGFLSAQIIDVGNGKFRITIIKQIQGTETKVRRYIDRIEFQKIQNKIDQLPDFTKEKKIEMYEGMDFLRAEKIINNIPKPQFVVIKHNDNKKLRGTLLKVEDNILHIQGPTLVEEINLSNLDKISYKKSFGKYDKYKNYFFVGNGILGFIVAYIYNSQRSVIYNAYDIPRNDIVFYRYLNGIILGLIFSSEVFDAISTLLTSTETIILSEAEYNEKNYNK